MWRQRWRSSLGGRLALAAACFFVLFTSHCSIDFDLCTPQQSRFAFFSKGDCKLTRASFFQGHEWLTFFGNRDLPPEDRFSQSETHTIAEGNRRVDWPKELLIHMNNGVLAYTSALIEFTDRPENQRLHFLLTDRNNSSEAAREANDEIVRATLEAIELWNRKRIRALTLLGRANHILQDSFSAAHTVRDPGHPDRPWCIVKVKAFIRRAPGFDTPDIEFHGSSDDSVGHTTTQDSIYRAGRDCHEPGNPDQVEACLSETAQRARLGTRDYLARVRALLRRVASGEPADEKLVRSELEPYFAQHLSMCP